jgi:sulfite reductase (ferredoxin)
VAVSRELGGDNSVDVFTQDIGLIAMIADGRLAGFVVIAGGGLGVTPSREDTFPRLGDVITFATPDAVLEVVTEIVKIQRDYGNRADRKRARLKYLIHDRGVAWFRDELAQRLERELPAPPAVPPLRLALHQGWREQADGRWTLGLFIENGRIRNEGDRRVFDGLRAIVSELRPEVRLTPHQDVLLANIALGDRVRVEALLAEYGIPHASTYRAARRHAMACPALPFCSQAITDAERALPEVMDELETALVRLGLDGDAITVRMTGCPNGCARPYVSDIGFVGRSIGAYAIYLGGSPDGTRLNRLLVDRVPERELVRVLEPILTAWRDGRRDGEGFGSFVDRLGVESFVQREEVTA